VTIFWTFLPELSHLVLSFLQKLSLFEENKNEMTQLGILEKAALFLDCSYPLAQEAAARVLYNLSFDAVLR